MSDTNGPHEHETSPIGVHGPVVSEDEALTAATELPQGPLNVSRLSMPDDHSLSEATDHPNANDSSLDRVWFDFRDAMLLAAVDGDHETMESLFDSVKPRIDAATRHSQGAVTSTSRNDASLTSASGVVADHGGQDAAVYELQMRLNAALTQTRDEKERRWRMELRSAETEVELKMIKQQLTEERQKWNAVQPALEARDAEIGELASKAEEGDMVRAQLLNAAAALEELKRSLSESHQENKELKESLADAEAKCASLTVEIANREEGHWVEVHRCKAEGELALKKLREALVGKEQAALQEAARARDTCRQSQLAHEGEVQLLEDLHRQEVVSVKVQLDEFVRSSKRLSQDLSAQFSAELANATSKISDLEAELEVWKGHADKAAKLLAEEQALRKRGDSENDEMTTKLETAVAEVSVLQAHKKQLSDTLVASEARVSELESQADERKAAHTRQLSQLQIEHDEELDRLRGSGEEGLAAAEAARVDAERAKQALAKVQQESDAALEQQKRESEQECQRIRHEGEQECEKMRKQLTDMEAKVEADRAIHAAALSSKDTMQHEVSVSVAERLEDKTTIQTLETKLAAECRARDAVQRLVQALEGQVKELEASAARSGNGGGNGGGGGGGGAAATDSSGPGVLFSELQHRVDTATEQLASLDLSSSVDTGVATSLLDTLSCLRDDLQMAVESNNNAAAMARMSAPATGAEGASSGNADMAVAGPAGSKSDATDARVAELEALLQQKEAETAKAQSEAATLRTRLKGLGSMYLQASEMTRADLERATNALGNLETSSRRSQTSATPPGSVTSGHPKISPRPPMPTVMQ